MNDNHNSQVNCLTSLTSDEFLAEFVPTHEVNHTIPSEWYWEKGRDYTKRITSVTKDIDREPERVLSLRAKYTYHLLQSCIGSQRELADIPGVLIKYGEAVSVDDLAKDLGKQRDELRQDIRQLIKYGVLFVTLFRVDGNELITLVDHEMYRDEVSGVRDKLRRRARLYGDDDAKEMYDSVKGSHGRPNRGDQENRLVTLKRGNPLFKSATEQNVNRNGEREPNVNRNNNNSSIAQSRQRDADAALPTPSLADQEKSAGSAQDHPADAAPIKDTRSVASEPKPAPAEPKKYRKSLDDDAFLDLCSEIVLKLPFSVKELDAIKWIEAQFPDLLVASRNVKAAVECGVIVTNDYGDFAGAAWLLENPKGWQNFGIEEASELETKISTLKVDGAM